jgi:CRP/FNR family transcriptional regulator, anaerobic regulatory protein
MIPTRLFIDKMQVICPDIDDNELTEFEKELYVKHFKKKEFIFDSTKPQDQIAYITSGIIRSYYINEQGSEITAWFVKEFDFVSDYPAFLNDAKSNYLFEAIENTTVVIIPKILILKAYETSPKFQKFGRLIAEEAVQFLQGRIESFLFKSATERYVEFMKNENELFNRLSVEHIATYLGVERQSLTRIRKKLSSK